MMKDQFKLMAHYNTVMNQKIIEVINGLSGDVLWQDQGAFFGSILGTLNHIMVGDLIWLTRFNQHPNYPDGFQALSELSKFPLPTHLTQTLLKTSKNYQTKRKVLDGIIESFIAETSPIDFETALTYHNTKGITHSKSFAALVQHLFNHQTHHRGQLTTLLNQMNLNVGETDLLMLITNVDASK